MSRLTLDQIPHKYHAEIVKQLYPNENSSATSCTKSKQIVRNEPLEQNQRETFYTGSVSVCITSYRRRLLDPDNLCGKYFLDAARYSMLIADDTPEKVSYTIKQVKVRKKEEEKTEIVILKLNPN